MKVLLPLLTGLLILSGCQVGRPSYMGLKGSPAAPLAQCSEETKAGGPRPAACIVQCRDTMNPNCPEADTSQEVKELKLIPNDIPPQLGLALSGGGSKTAPYAIGVLKRFVDNGWLFRTQYIVSVSGGSYSALYLYYRAYRAIMADEEQQDTTLPRATPPEDPSITAENAQWPGLTRYFADSRNYNTDDFYWPFVDMHSVDWVKNGSLKTASLASKTRYCVELTTVDPIASRELHTRLPPVWAQQNQGVYMGWVECYQDMLMTHPTEESTSNINGGQLAGDFTGLFFQSAMAAPLHWFSNVLFDWKKNFSPSQIDYLHGIERTYAYFPEPGKILPVSLGDETLNQLTDCLDFKDVAEIYMKDEPSTKRAIGGYLPKWVLESTGTNGNVGLNWTPRHYDLSRDVFEISFDEYGSGRFGYVEGSPSLIGLTVPWAVLASAAFADSAQRSLTVPRGVIDAVLQTVDIKWGIDVANYNVSNGHRFFHSLLIWPFYYADDPTNPDTPRAAHAPTIHLSDGGQSGDNLGLVAMFRRNVRNIVIASGEDDFHAWGHGQPEGWIGLGSLCAANYYLMQQGYTMVFEADPRDPSPGPQTPYDLSEHCTWKGDSDIYVHPDTQNITNNLTPFNWVRRVWMGTVELYDPEKGKAAHPGAFPNPPDPVTELDDIPYILKGIHVYYLNAAMDRDSWVRLARGWYPRPDPNPYAQTTIENSLVYHFSGPTDTPHDGALASVWYPQPAPALVCESEQQDVSVSGPESTVSTNLYSCPLLNYVSATDEANTPKHDSWHFPQTSTWFTTFDNSVNLFRAYRDLGWQYAGELEKASPELARILNGPPNPLPDEFQRRYPEQASVHRDANVCRNWVGPTERNTSALHASSGQ